MSCKDCFNGCGEIGSDQCIRYTGPTIASLNITNGDPLSVVGKSITDYLLTVLDGTGIVPNINSAYLCTAISDYLPTSGDITLVDYLNAIFQVTCAIRGELTTLTSTVNGINSAYTVGCLTGITDNTDTHEVLQAAITKLCTVDTSLSNLILTLPTTYVALADFNSLVATYLASSPTTTLMSSKMIPYTAVEYYGSLGNFDASGAGLGLWDKIYLCNGSNGTPDKRGRVSVCAINGMGGGVLNSVVDPANVGNPNYSLYSVQGLNTVSLSSISQIPSHTHSATAITTVGTHSHLSVGIGGNNISMTAATPIRVDNSSFSASYTLRGTDSVHSVGKTSDDKSTVSVAVTNAPTGSGAPHDNIQPVIACYYIMYIP